ncbi:MAG: dTMP kinase [Thermoleophilia bacterium]|nr:MAG: dTMP kinase [Thermoleophilia bacterium]
MFVSLEGPDGVGKSTQVALLADRLRGIGLEVVQCREPGGTELGERVRALLLDPQVELSDRAEALLFAAARAEIVEQVIAPALARGAWVVCDRFIDSSLVYQGVGRGLGIEEIRDVSLFATGGLLPARTIVLHGVARRDAVSDRMESAGEEFHARVEQGFLRLGELEPARVRLVDAQGSEAEVAERIWSALEGVRP